MKKYIKTLLVDDEYLALNLLENFVKQIPDLELVAKIKSPVEALDILRQDQIELLFLDVQMPGLSGNNLLKTLRRPPLTIFTTAYADYAVEAFDLNAVDYLLKPVSFERFLQAVQKAKEQLSTRRASFSNPSKLPIKDFLTVKADGMLRKVYLSEILFIEGLKEYVRIVTNSERIVFLESLKQLEENLPSNQFLRVHKSYIVAKDKVRSLEGTRLLIDSFKIPVSRSKKEAVAKEIFGASI